MKNKYLILLFIPIVCLSSCSSSKHTMFPRSGYSLISSPNDSLLIINIEGVQASKQGKILDEYDNVLKSKTNFTVVNRYDAMYKLKLWFKEFPTYYNIDNNAALKIKKVTGANYLLFIKVLSKSEESPIYTINQTNNLGRQPQSIHNPSKVKVGVAIYSVKDGGITKVFELKTTTKEILFEKSNVIYYKG